MGVKIARESDGRVSITLATSQKINTETITPVEARLLAIKLLLAAEAVEANAESDTGKVPTAAFPPVARGPQAVGARANPTTPGLGTSVEHDQLGPVALGRGHRLVAVGGGVHAIAAGLEAGRQHGHDLRIIVDHEHGVLAGHTGRLWRG